MNPAISKYMQLTQPVEIAAERMREERQRQIYAMARAVGLPDNATCIHNASLDDGER